MEEKGGCLKLLQINSSPVNWGSLAAYIMTKIKEKKKIDFRCPI